MVQAGFHENADGNWMQINPLYRANYANMAFFQTMDEKINLKKKSHFSIEIVRT